MLNNLKVKLMLSTVLLLTFTKSFAAPLYIDITGGKNLGIPIAVLPFSTAKSSDPIDRAVDVMDIGTIVNNDLYTSGHFNTLDVQNIDAYPSDVKGVDFGYWKNFGAAYLVIGKIASRGAGTYDVSFELIDIYKNNMQPLLNVKISGKDQAQFRALAHYISDLIFEKLTGVRGFFSTRIAYITVDRSREETIHTLHVADADGYNSKAILSVPYPIMSPRWSPDGKWIVYVALTPKYSAINVINIATGNREQVTKFPGINGAPAWSPDGRKLAMVLSKDGSPKIYVLDLTSKELRRITSGGAIDTEPFWDPSGQSLVFTSNRGGKPQIYRVILQSGEVQRLTFTGDYNATPSLTPDGKQLVMLHQSEKGAYNIAVQDLSTGKVKAITSANLDESPTLAPNGMMVLYGLRDADRSYLGAVTLDGKFRMRLPLQAENVKEPAWSPFL